MRGILEIDGADELITLRYPSFQYTSNNTRYCVVRSISASVFFSIYELMPLSLSIAIRKISPFASITRPLRCPTSPQIEPVVASSISGMPQPFIDDVELAFFFIKFT